MYIQYQRLHKIYIMHLDIRFNKLHPPRIAKVVTKTQEHFDKDVVMCETAFKRCSENLGRAFREICDADTYIYTKDGLESGQDFFALSHNGIIVLYHGFQVTNTSCI
jgi:hypothetical protein